MPTTPSDPTLLLVDNGSLRPDATFSLRRLAAALGERAGRTVHPVSLLHSHKISPEKLGGDPAQTFERFVRARLASGDRHFLVQPLFFGPSAAVNDYLPALAADIFADTGCADATVHVAPTLVDLRDPADDRMGRILADLAEQKIAELGLAAPAIALVDHGTPQAPVNAIRDHLAAQMKALLGGKYPHLSPCSMERRDGPEYDFNEPLLENLLGSDGFGGDVVVSMLFISPGRHAGDGGDIAKICAEAEAAHAGLKTHMTDLVSAHPTLVDLLHCRLEEGLAGKAILPPPAKAA